MPTTPRRGGPTARTELAAVEADEQAQERRPAGLIPTTSPVTAPTYVRATDPQGRDVTFTPGEALPAWVAPDLEQGRLDPQGVLVIAPAL